MPLTTQRWVVLPLAALLMLVLTACAPIPGTSWAGLLALTVADVPAVLVAHQDRITLVDVNSGQTVPLRDAQGVARVDERGTPLTWQVLGNTLDNAQFYAAPTPLGAGRLLAGTMDSRLVTLDLPTARVITASDPINARGRLLTDLSEEAGLVFAGLNDQLVALDATTLAQRWAFPTGQSVWSVPVVADDTVYFTSLDHNLYAVDLADGQQRWSLNLGGAAASAPLLYDDHLYVGSFGRKLLKVALDGSVVAEYVTQDWVWSTPTVDEDGVLYFGDLAGNLYALNAEQNLAELWRAKVANGAIRATPIVYDRLVVVASRDRHVYWVTRANGTPVQNRVLEGEVLADMLVFTPEQVPALDAPMFVVSTTNNAELLVAFTITTGERLWTYRR